jgi:hypothetical protein
MSDEPNGDLPSIAEDSVENDEEPAIGPISISAPNLVPTACGANPPIDFIWDLAHGPHERLRGGTASTKYWEALAQLPKRQQALLLLTCQGVPALAIAERVGIEPTHVEALVRDLHAALATLFRSNNQQ